MIIEIEDRFCKVAKAFSEVINKVQCSAERGDAVHEVQELPLKRFANGNRRMSRRTGACGLRRRGREEGWGSPF